MIHEQYLDRTFDCGFFVTLYKSALLCGVAVIKLYHIDYTLSTNLHDL